MKIATIEDLPTVTTMAMKFISVSGYAEYSDEETVINLLRKLIEDDPKNSIVLLSDSGFITGTVTPFILGKCLLASEIGWWVEEDKRGTGEGLKLLGAFEYWAKNIAEVKLISMTSLDSKVEKYYKKNGYKLYERAYMKVF